MNYIAKTVVFLGVLVSDWPYSPAWAETFPPLNCSTSSVRSCNAYIYLRNVTESLETVASRFNISTQQIEPFSAPDYLARIRCSCLDFLGTEALFYKVNYTLQSSDTGLVRREISDKYFSHTAWTEVNALDTYQTGDTVELGLGCGCPIPGWNSIVSYAVPPGDSNVSYLVPPGVDLWKINTTFNSNFDDIIRLNNLTDPSAIRANRVYFIPYLSDGSQRSSPPSTAGGILLLLLLIITFYYGYCKRAASLQSSTGIENGQTEYWVAHTSEIISLYGTEQKHEQGEKLDKGLSLPIFTNLTHDEIILMKSYCTEHHEIGEGSFGKVYLGNLKDQDVAIKKIKRAGKESKKLVVNEVRLLQGKQHQNLVSIVAWCIEENTFYLVYEYVNGCTLDEYLRENSAQYSVSWKKCLKIISGIAEGIQFLHLNNIIHVDIKPQNLMVDSKDTKVKIIDFGFSKHVDWEGTHRSTDRITGTRGYWAPEYCFNNNLSYKHDVYSFGIVVLEVITGQKHVDNARSSSQFHIPDYVRYMMACNRFEEALDERLKGEGFDECDLMNALVVANLALKCAEAEKEERPDMSYVMSVLNTMDRENNEGNSSGIII